MPRCEENRIPTLVHYLHLSHKLTKKSICQALITSLEPKCTIMTSCLAVFKKLRVTDPDLKVVLQYKDNNGKDAKQEYAMYSHLLANLSVFVDTALSVDMKEKETKTITLPDVTPEVFDLAIKLETSPAAARTLTLEDAMKVVGFYHKYQFSGGLELCDLVLYECFEQKSCKQRKKEPVLDVSDLFAPLRIESPGILLQLLVDAALFAQDFDLEKSKKSSVRWLSLNMNGTLGNNNVFNVSHIKKLHPLFKAGLLSGVKSLAKLTSAEVESPLFPKYFVLERRLS